MSKRRLNQSRIKDFLSCRLRYRYRYIDNLSPKAPTARPLQLGGIVHHILHLYDKNELDLDLLIPDPDPDKHLSKLETLIDQLYPGNDAIEGLTADIASEAALLSLSYIKTWRDANLKLIPGETILEYELPSCILVGRTDGWARTQDNRLGRNERKTTAKFDSKYLDGLRQGLQGAVYDFLSEKLFHEELSGTVYDLIVKMKVPQFHRNYVRINRQSIARMLETLAGVNRSMDRGDFYPSSDCNSYVRACDYKSLCDYDSEEVRRSFFKPRVSDYVDNPDRTILEEEGGEVGV